MKKKVIYYLIGIAIASSTLFSGCIQETIPTNTITSEQLASSAKSTEALLWAMPAFTNKYNVLNAGRHSDFGYGAMMHIRDVMGEDMAIVSSGYDWFSSWAQNIYMGDTYVYAQQIWNYYAQFILTANNMIATIDPESATEIQLNYLGVGYAFRAMQYLDWAQMCEFLENDKTTPVNATGNNVLNLTVPIVDEKTTEADARNNPRATREQMAAFILTDLNNAEKDIQGFARPSKVFPDLSVVYGLKARYYMWLGDYPNAQTYARKAIDTGGYTPTTKDQWLSKTNGFNDLSTPSWMWGSQMMAEDDVVQTGIINWTSWMSNETTFGYASAGPYVMIGASFYNQISDDDFRKLSWKAPAGTPLFGKTPFIDPEIGADLPDYASTKFRPAQGDVNEFKVGAASAYPMMRIEEMYFIEAEAAAHQNAANGKALLESFMQTYRCPSYTCPVSDTEGVVSEIFLQKRVELWGEGLNFFDYKRLNKTVTRGYTGTNFSDASRFNTTTRPAWMNICIVQTEKNNNSALMGFENPDPSGLYTPWK